MIDFASFHEARRLSRENLTPWQIAQKLVRNIKTIRKSLLKRRYEPRQSTRRPSILDPYIDLIIAWLEKHPFTGMQIYQRLRAENGYTGGYTIVKDFIACVRPIRHEAFLKLEFEPGD